MTGPVERVPLTDEHLLQLETLWLGPTGTGRTSEELTAARLEQFGRIALEDVPGLLAELRASRAREAELLEAFQNASDSADQWCAAEEKVAAERDELQQRIDRAGRIHCWTNEEGKRFVFADDLLAALTGTET